MYFFKFLLRSPCRVVAALGILLVVNLLTVYLFTAGDRRPDIGRQGTREVAAQAALITQLQRNLSQLQLQLQHLTKVGSNATHLQNVIGLRKVGSEDDPTVYVITPTYARWTQKADLTRLCQTLMHVPNLYWIVVEDSEEKTRLVARFLARCKVASTHLNVRTAKQLQRRENEPVWKKSRGVKQRNLAIDWLRESATAGKLPGKSKRGVVYFGDDDNTYDIQLFDEMRDTQLVSVWPVGICGGLKFEGPKCQGGRVTGWYTAWGFERPFQIDMAGFAVNLQLLLAHPEAKIDPSAPRGYLESSLLEKLVSMRDLEPKAEDCTKVWVWHTRTEVPNMKHEDRLIKQGKPSNPHIET